MSSQNIKNAFVVNRKFALFLLPQCQSATQLRLVHHHKELEVPGGFERFIGLKRSNPQRANRNTHTNELKFRRLRGQKRLIMDITDDVEQREMQQMKMDQLRIYLLRKGKPDMYKDLTPRQWREHQMTMHSLYDVMDPYVPPETSKWARLKERELYTDSKDYFSAKYANIRGYGLRRIRKKQGFENFDLKEFVKKAEDIYKDTFKALARRDKQRLHQLVTEAAFSKLWPDVEKGTLEWEMVQFNEPSIVSNVRCLDFPLNSGNDIAQITVRMHSTQKMALYDKDGHLLLGSMDEPRHVLEYIVFEQHVANQYGDWRYHAKINPHWLKPKQAVQRPALVEEFKEKKQLPTEPIKLRVKMDAQIEKSKKQLKENENDKMDGSL